MKGTTIEEELLEPVDISKVHPYYGAQRKESEVFKEYEAMKEQQMMDAMGWDPELAMKDIERVQELGPDNAQNLRNLATMSLRMMQMDDPEMKANALVE
jgi:predicted transcriptional regulator